MTDLYPCLKCGKEPALVQTFGQWTVNCPCGVKLGHRFFNRQTAIDHWNRSGHECAAKTAAAIKRSRKKHEQSIKLFGEKIIEHRLEHLKKLPEDTFLTLEEAILLTGREACFLARGRYYGVLVYDENGKYRKKELLTADYDNLPKIPMRNSVLKFTHKVGTPEREEEEAALRLAMFAEADSVLFSAKEARLFACTSREMIIRAVKEGKLKKVNGLFRKGDLVKWRRKYPPQRGGAGTHALKKLRFMLKGDK